jgi:uncharacterized protein (TIGR04255 family)
VAPFQEALRKDYPLAEQWATQPFQFQLPSGEGSPLVSLPVSRTHRFSTVDGAWRLSLSTDFLSLETLHYTSRRDFLERLNQAWTALAAHVAPSHWNRLGVRYVDRIRGAELARVGELFRPEMLGLLGSGAGGEHIKQILAESLVVVPEGNLAIRWGLLPAGRTTDPIGIPVENQASYILDLDAFQEGRLEPFVTADLVAHAQALSDRIYSFFRWAIQPEFLRTYGG